MKEIVKKIDEAIEKREALRRQHILDAGKGITVYDSDFTKQQIAEIRQLELLREIFSEEENDPR